MVVVMVAVTVGMAAASGLAALFKYCRQTRPVGAPPDGNATAVTRRRRRVTTTVSSNDSVVATGSLPAALLLPSNHSPHGNVPYLKRSMFSLRMMLRVRSERSRRFCLHLAMLSG